MHSGTLMSGMHRGMRLCWATRQAASTSIGSCTREAFQVVTGCRPTNILGLIRAPLNYDEYWICSWCFSQPLEWALAFSMRPVACFSLECAWHLLLAGAGNDPWQKINWERSFRERKTPSNPWYIAGFDAGYFGSPSGAALLLRWGQDQWRQAVDKFPGTDTWSNGLSYGLHRRIGDDDDTEICRKDFDDRGFGHLLAARIKKNPRHILRRLFEIAPDGVLDPVKGLDPRRADAVIRWRRAHEAHRDASMVFRAASEGRPMELEKRLRLGKLAGGLTRAGRAGSGAWGAAAVRLLSPMEAARVGGHGRCVAVL